MRGCHWATVVVVVVVCAVSGAAGCGRGSTTTRAPPIVEPEIQAVTAPSNARTGGHGRQQGGGSRSRGQTTSIMSTIELRTATEELLNLDTGMPQPVVSLQGQTSGNAAGDAAPRPLITSVQQATMTKETVSLMQQLLDNYDPQTSRQEMQTNAERAEENRFLEAVMRTPLMQRLEAILRQKGVLQGSLRDTLKLIWFTLYKRGGRQISSSGFEHVFVGEVKNSKVSGFHNWLTFFKEEGEGDLDYKGYLKKLNLGNKGEIIKMRFVWMGNNKPVGSVFVGTTPELEMALYTLCFLVKPNSRCPVQLAGNRFQIQTWTQSYHGKTLVGSAYPEI